MKRIFATLLIGSIFCILNVLTAEVKEKNGDEFLRVNDNIQNEELRVELGELKEQFNIERKRIREYYKDKMEALKKSRLGDMKTMKGEFAGRREVLMKKYIGKMRKKPQMGSTEAVKNAPNKMKVPPKEKKKIRKP
tara:strand:+ start:110 stop:517 length:408 start_codon:yes stop_codon:yes gene_type:complete